MSLDDMNRAGDGWEGSIGGTCPVQGYGTVDGHQWCFRARGNTWEMVIADGHDDQLDCYVHNDPSSKPGWWIREAWGTWPEAGYMPLATAWEKIEQAISALRAGKLPRCGEKQ